MATSWRSGSSSSFASSALSAPPSHPQHASPVDSTFTPTSAAISALTADPDCAALCLLTPRLSRKLFDRTPNELTVYLGPWEIVGANPRRLLWQCSYAGEVLEHFLPSDNPNELFPHTLHAQHRRFGDPREMELYLSFQEPHRIRYTTTDGIVHDEYIEVKYEFTTIEGSIQLQSDIRRRDLIDWFDVDVVWSDTHRRTDSYGNVRGLGTIQRIKLWRDRYSTFHYLTFYANHRRRWKEYLLDDFDRDLRQRDDRHKRVQLGARGARRGSASESSQGHSRERRFSTSIFSRSSRHNNAPATNGNTASSSAQSALDIRYLGIQFSRNPNIQAGSDDTRFALALPRTIVLAVNAGSSSVKVSVYTAEQGQSPTQIAEAQVSGLTAPPAALKYERDGKTIVENREVDDQVNGQRDAFSLVLDTLIGDHELPSIKSKEDIGILCHRIVHGGDYTEPQLVSDGTYHHLENLNDLAPLHNANSLGIVRLCIQEFPSARNVACFDSQFHSTIPEHIRTYPIKRDIARKNRLRKYGFHGISYSFITRATAEFLGKQPDEINIIALHLGSGASACAIKSGKSWDTSMGLTPLAGLPGATRSGSVDPSLVFHYASDVGKLSPASTKDLHISRAEEILNKQAGWKALAGTTNFGVIAGAGPSEEDGDKRLAFDLFVDRVCGFVGSYYVSLRGRVDALVFAGGIGEKSDRLRAAVVEQAGCLGFVLDQEANSAHKVAAQEGVVHDVGKEGVTPRVLVCRTDEQFEMSRACAEDEAFW
ncbi:Acetokinase family-domain-containing protein [Parachaetomium inaequale]|uniref:Probable acetate kinase n=1 Tax=Parachaetomium inaequale TaxID=2588326 RepID=A0AAN6SSL9_9PEZI|nr:Acetokinase family-domain-containing protein [Parachaetomium inaequale]